MKRLALGASIAAAILTASCKDATEPPGPASITLSPSAATLDAVGATQTISALVKDQAGTLMATAPVTWTSSSPIASVVGTPGTGGVASTAVITAAANGVAIVTATSGNATATVNVTITQTPTFVSTAAGDRQTGAAGAPLATQVRVRVLDRLNAPVVGAAVSFAVTLGGGTVSSAAATSGGDGTAATTWTLGPSVTTGHEVTATVAGLSTPVRFTAIAVAGPPASVVPTGDNNLIAFAGGSLSPPPAVRVVDAFGNPVAGASVTFSVTGGTGTITGATQTTNGLGIATVGSWTFGAGPGTNSLSASITGSTIAPAVFTFNAIGGGGGTMSFTAGTNQSAVTGSALPTPPSVVIRDLAGNPIAGIPVTFTASDGGTVVGGTATTNAAGVATAGSWTLGPTAVSQTLTVTAGAVGVANNPAVTTAVGCLGGGGTGFAITLCLTTQMTASQRAAFETAAARWKSIITGDLSDVVSTFATNFCVSGTPRVAFPIDDVVIMASVTSIDGPGGILGQAGWCAQRQGSVPVYGIMRFDSADMTTLEAQSLLNPVILHEMGHVLGFGAQLWTPLGLIVNPVSTGGPTLDTYFNGANAIASFNAIGGATYTGGQKVPLENTVSFGPGTFNSHWRESVLRNEMMTGFIDAGTNPLSEVTVRAMMDLGYVVNPLAADPFALTLSLKAPAASGTSIRLINDGIDLPRYTVDKQGRMVRIR
jgi:hypothetical protein